ncbi:11558_t:CDS:10 [Gigaspora rosea]|nr:11558_t:CDS:10 [Gigaspora rosea]
MVPQHSLSGEPHNLSRSNKKKNFRAESDVVGPNNMTSLDYNTSDDQSQNKITDAPFLVEEPQDVEELEITESDRSFNTPSENMKKYPVTPPHNPRLLNSKSHHSQTLPLHLHPTLSVVNSTLEEDNSQHDDASISSINLSNIPINHDELNDPNSDANNANVNSDAGYFDIPAYFTNSSGWREYNVKLKPDRIEFYKNKKKAVDQLIFSSSTRIDISTKNLFLSVGWYLQIPLKDVRQAFKIAAEKITNTVLDELSGINELEDVLNEWLQNSDMRLCWKRYDRIEWIVWEKNDDDEKDRSDLLACPQFIEREPPPVEGYLIRVTNEKGCKNSPPPPPSSSLEAGSGPQYVDAFLKANSKRRIKQIINAYGFINLIDVKEVRSLMDDNSEDACENDHAEDQSKEPKSEGKGKEWVNCLDAFIKYWKARVADDVKIQINTFKINQFNNYDDNSANIGDGIRGNWDNFRSYANPTIWHWCILNGCLGITAERHHQSIRLLCILGSNNLSYSRNLNRVSTEMQNFPRIYSDGMCCFDEDDECTLVVWQGNKHHVIKRSGAIGVEFRKKATLDSVGKVMIF